MPRAVELALDHEPTGIPGEHGVVAIEGIDTRALVRHLRDNGAQKGIVSTEVFDLAELAHMLDSAPDLVGTNLVQTVSCKEAYGYDASGLSQNRAFAAAAPANARKKVVVYDCGVKRGILEGLARVGCELLVVPWDTPAAEVLAMAPTACSCRTAQATPRPWRARTPRFSSFLGRCPCSASAWGTR